MLINSDNKKYRTRSKHHTCEHHKKHPKDNYAGCTCSSQYWQEEIKDDKEINNE